MNLQSIFSALGMEPQEGAVYVLLAKLGPTPASTIAKKLTIKRTTCYMLLEKLVSKGILDRSVRKNVRYYQAVSIKHLENRIDDQLASLQEAKQQLKDNAKEFTLLFQNIEEDTEVVFYEGYDEIKKAYEKILYEDDPVIYSMTKKQVTDSHILNTFWKSYLAKRLDLGKKTVSVVNEDKASQKYIKDAKKEGRSVKVLPKSDVEIYGDLKVCGEVVAFISQHEGRIWALTLRDKEISKMFRDLIKFVYKKAV